MHGFSQEALSRRLSKNVSPSIFFKRRMEFINHVLKYNIPCKINYVYSDQKDEEDIKLLLDWSKGQDNVLINLLDNLNDLNMNSKTIENMLIRLQGNPENRKISIDPDSLDVLHFYWKDGLKVELKHKRLGDINAYSSCNECKKKDSCREGIYALRLMSSGNIQLCMDRPDVFFPLGKIIKENGIDEAKHAWDEYFHKVVN